MSPAVPDKSVVAKKQSCKKSDGSVAGKVVHICTTQRVNG